MTAVVPALRAEWLKATTLRSTWACLLAYAVTVFGVSVGAVAAIGRSQAAQADYDPAVLAYYGLNFGHVAVIVLAVLLTAGEYGQHTVHTSLTAVPRRGVFLAAQFGVGAGLVLLTAAGTAVATFLATQALLGPAGTTLAAPGAVRSLVAAVVQPTVLAVSCMAVGVLMRDQSGALSLLVPFFFLVSPVLELVPVLQDAVQFLPDRAGAVAIRTYGRPVDLFGPVTGLAICVLWAGAAVLVARWALQRRDA